MWRQRVICILQVWIASYVTYILVYRQCKVSFCTVKLFALNGLTLSITNTIEFKCYNHGSFFTLRQTFFSCDNEKHFFLSNFYYQNSLFSDKHTIFSSANGINFISARVSNKQKSSPPPYQMSNDWPLITYWKPVAQQGLWSLWSYSSVGKIVKGHEHSICIILPTP